MACKWLCIFIISVSLTTVSVAYRSQASDLREYQRHRRSFSVPFLGSLFGETKKNEIPHLGQYPLWKVHKYNGISLKPMVSMTGPGLNVPLTLPDSLPLPPQVPGEPPSIVNVPDPNYAPPGVAEPPRTIYDPPQASNGQYPPYQPPNGEYPPSQPPNGEYPPMQPPIAPPPPRYNAPLGSGPFSGASSNGDAGAGDFANPSEGDTAAALDTLSNLGALTSLLPEGSSDSALSNILDFTSILPPAAVQRFQNYIATPEGKERVVALLGIAMNARKLKSNAAHSIRGYFRKLFGGAGGSTNVGLQSGTYTNIPETYPASQGIFNSLPLIGTGSSALPMPDLPNPPSLPKIPGMYPLPDIPMLPHINLPSINSLPPVNSGNSYVSIKLPQPPVNGGYAPPISVVDPPQFSGSSHSIDFPTPEYGLPSLPYEPPQSSGSSHSTDFPAPEYGLPPQTYQPPQTNNIIPATSYGVPNGPTYSYPSYAPQTPQQTYGLPNDIFSSASEIVERIVPRNKESANNQLTALGEETPSSSSGYSKVTRLHRVDVPKSTGSQMEPAEDMRMYLDPKHPAASVSAPVSKSRQEQQRSIPIDTAETTQIQLEEKETPQQISQGRSLQPRR